MAKHNLIERDRDDRVEVKSDSVLDIPRVVDFELPQPTVQSLVLLKDVRLNVIGPVTGKTYQFSGAGSVVDVDIDDVAGLLAKNNPSSCCGVGGPTPYFMVGG